jgi:hypothetical protein
VLGANREQIRLFWNIGRIIIENTSYGAKFIENLARDIKAEFPNAKGYSVRNLKYMRKFAALLTDEGKVQTLSALLSWSHNTYLFDKTKTLNEYLRLSCGRTHTRTRGDRKHRRRKKCAGSRLLIARDKPMIFSVHSKNNAPKPISPIPKTTPRSLH